MGDIAVPHVAQGSVDFSPVLLVQKPALLPVRQHHFAAPPHLPRRHFPPPGEAAGVVDFRFYHSFSLLLFWRLKEVIR